MAEFGEDLWMEILKRLGVKSICRFRCVCKAWNSLLSSSFFIGLQYKFRASDKKSYLFTNHSGNCKIQHCTLYDLRESKLEDRFTFRDLPYSIEDAKRSGSECVCYAIVGVIHGVVCLTSRFNVVVWNPASRRSIFHRREREGTEGFGFDAAENDFKVVVVSRLSPRYDVLSVRDGCWRRGSVPDSIYRTCKIVSNSCFLNGAVYWIAENEKEKHKVLLLFDLEREEFKTTQLSLMDDEEHTLAKRHLFVYNDMLAVVRSRTEYTEPFRCELWVMEQETGVWKRLHRVGVFALRDGPDAHLFVQRRRGNGQPLASLLFQESLFLMDVKTSENHHRDAPLHCNYCYTNDRIDSHKTSFACFICKIYWHELS